MIARIRLTAIARRTMGIVAAAGTEMDMGTAATVGVAAAAPDAAVAVGDVVVLTNLLTAFYHRKEPSWIHSHVSTQPDYKPNGLSNKEE
ncbi:hypothetical protein [Hymenobacter sp. GOD-10R]|uniref:hypothetical protein n=1 Tax=Hymenobacter sp. GOD-10R TaxID=3093922 RepID=UPI002D7872CE|nr:hypothetical protein [Hymenobacter sp. GOD-10R]WRQ27017.1 hypothetical protein SD425_18250 [Hymenobacter sp. GOD-10R]